jgi:acetyl esterase/lipase
MTPALPALPLSSAVAPSDLSTSTVVRPDGAPRIAHSEEGLVFRPGIVYTAHERAGGSEEELRLDILAPAAGDRPKPLVLYLSGGGFLVSLKDAARDHRAYVARAGFVVASLEYSVLSSGPGVTFADSVQDVKAAIRFLRAHAAEYGIDPGAVAVWGESAGGYLAAMAGVTGGVTAFDAGGNLEQRSDVQAVVDKFGASDLSLISEDFDKAAQASWTIPDGPIGLYVHGPEGGPVVPGTAAIERANPIAYVTADAPAFLLYHGSADSLISPSQTLRLHSALLARGVDSTRYVLDGANHGDMAFLGDEESGRVWSTTTVMDQIVDFLRGRLLR